MNIRNKILLYFSIIIPALVGLAFVFVYFLFSENREEEFQMRQKEKISTTLNFLAVIKQSDDNLIEALDRLTIHDLYNEKLLLFNSKKELIYASVDDTPVPLSKGMLTDLNAENKWIETKEGLYDVVGTYIEKNGSIYYGISKAYDNYGYSKLRYLKFSLIITFLSISMLIVLLSFYISKRITEPLAAITKRINEYNFEEKFTPINIEKTENEVAILANQFNKLMKRMNDVFSFQKHAIHHISHELKTPIAVLVSNFERIEKEDDKEKIKALITLQKEDTKSLSEIINSLLEIAKTESGNTFVQEQIRIDELIFDVSEELKQLYPDFVFSIEYLKTENETSLTVSANPRLIKAALMNLMLNCVQYSSNKKAKITLNGEQTNRLDILFENKGAAINSKENQYIFQHFFRGENSKGKRGFGLGLVFIHKIILLHGGRVSYTAPDSHTNIFTITLPLNQNQH